MSRQSTPAIRRDLNRDHCCYHSEGTLITLVGQTNPSPRTPTGWAPYLHYLPYTPLTGTPPPPKEPQGCLYAPNTLRSPRTKNYHATHGWPRRPLLRRPTTWLRMRGHRSGEFCFASPDLGTTFAAEICRFGLRCTAMRAALNRRGKAIAGRRRWLSNLRNGGRRSE